MRNEKLGKTCYSYIDCYKTARYKQLGFTLIELMTVLGLVSILSSFWMVPAYQRWLSERRLEIKARQLFRSLTFARAIARQQSIPITVCSSDDSQSCGSKWSKGWIILAHPTGCSNTDILQAYSGLSSEQNLIFKGARHLKQIQFQPSGTNIGKNGHFVLCAKGSKIVWLIWISHTGRSRLEASCDLSHCASSIG